jgi:hypothetical protein
VKFSITFKLFNDFDKQVSSFSFRIMKKYYTCCSPWQLRWRSRKFNIIKDSLKNTSNYSRFMTSRRGETYAYRKICCIDISVKSNKHAELSKLSKTNGKITNSFTSVNDVSVIKSEVVITKLLIQLSWFY